MQCGLSAVWSRPRRLLPNNLMQPEQAVKEATRPPSPVNHRWQPKPHCSITEPQRRAEPPCTLDVHVADEHRAAGRETADRYRRGAAMHSPYYKWRRCFWQSLSLQCPLHRHLQENKHGVRGRRRWETTLNRSRGRRPDCNPDRQRAAAEYHAAAGTELRVGTAFSVDKASSSPTIFFKKATSR